MAGGRKSTAYTRGDSELIHVAILLLKQSSYINCSFTGSFAIFSTLRQNVYEEVEDVILGHSIGNISPLESPTLVVLRLDPRAQCEFENENFTGFGKDNWCLSWNSEDGYLKGARIKQASKHKIQQFSINSTNSPYI